MVIVEVEWAPAVVVAVPVIVDFTVDPGDAVGVSTGGGVGGGVFSGVVVETIPIGVHVDADVLDSVVVVVGVPHVEQTIVVVVGVDVVRAAVVVTVSIEEVGDTVTVEVTVPDLGEAWVSRVEHRFESEVVETVAVDSVVFVLPQNRSIIAAGG